jgi:ABC-type transport system involved in cytochrome c biogenesis permease component
MNGLGIIAERELGRLARSRWLYLRRLAHLLVPMAICLGPLPPDVEPMDRLIVTGWWLSLVAWFAGGTAVADAISAERREGTLGLLMLTPLKPVEILMGKWMSRSLAHGLSVLAVIPIMAGLVIGGGVNLSQIILVLLVVLGSYILSSSVGLLVSCVNDSARNAYVITLGILTLFLVVPLLLPRLSQVEVLSGGANDSVELLHPLLAGYWVWTDKVVIKYPPTGWEYSLSSTSAVLAACISMLAPAVVLLGFAERIMALSWRDRDRKTPLAGRKRGMSRFRGRHHTTAPAMNSALPSDTSLDEQIGAVAGLWEHGSRLPKRIQVLFGVMEAILIGSLFTVLAMYCFDMHKLDDVRFTALFPPILIGAIFFESVFKLIAGVEMTRKLMEDRDNGGLELITCTPVHDFAMTGGITVAIDRMISRFRKVMTLFYVTFGFAGIIAARTMEQYEVIDSLQMTGVASLCLGMLSYASWTHHMRSGMAAALKEKNSLRSAVSSWLWFTVGPYCAGAAGLLPGLLVMAAGFDGSDSHAEWIIALVLFLPPLLIIQLFCHMLSFRKFLQYEFFRAGLQEGMFSKSRKAG